jgi:adenine-specific DNA-methyltransferase
LNDGWRWKWGKDKFEWGKKNGFIELKQSKDKECGWSVYYKIYMNVDNEGINITRSSPFKNLIQGILNTHASNESKELFNTSNLFSNPKPTKLIKFFINLTVDKSAIILDFFAGSGTTAHAVMSLNAEDGGNRKYICVQIPEPTPENSEAKKAGYKTIAEITKERIRRAGEKVKADNPLFAGDIGFKVFKLDESNFKQWDKEVADAEALKQQIMEFADNVSPEASKANMLYELLLKKGYSLNAKVAKKQIADNEIFVVDGSMLVCLDDKISIATIDEVIKLRPAHFIVLDRAFEGNDQLKTNTWQTFKSLFPNDENPFETV